MTTLPFGFGEADHIIRVDRVIYTTITLMAVLIVYDGWEQLRFAGVVAVMLGPVLAICLSHVFGGALGTRVASGRQLTRGERRAVFLEECRFLLIAVPPLAILVVLAIAGVSYTRGGGEFGCLLSMFGSLAPGHCRNDAHGRVPSST